MIVGQVDAGESPQRIAHGSIAEGAHYPDRPPGPARSIERVGEFGYRQTSSRRRLQRKIQGVEGGLPPPPEPKDTRDADPSPVRRCSRYFHRTPPSRHGELPARPTVPPTRTVGARAPDSYGAIFPFCIVSCPHSPVGRKNPAQGTGVPGRQLQPGPFGPLVALGGVHDLEHGLPVPEQALGGLRDTTALQEKRRVRLIAPSANSLIQGIFQTGHGIRKSKTRSMFPCRSGLAATR